MAVRVTVWNESALEHKGKPQEVYPFGKQNTIKDFLSKDPAFEVRAVNLEEPGQGLPDEILDNTDVLLWWGHSKHGLVDDALVSKIVSRILGGMGFIPMHSAHMSKVFKRLMGTEGLLHWGDDMKEVIWTVMPAHPIASGVPEHFVLECEEMYGEPFDIPQPDELVFVGWFKNGYVFRSGCTFYRGNGKIFYFQPGHESLPSFHDENVQKILTNAVHWAAPGQPTPRINKTMEIHKNFND